MQEQAVKGHVWRLTYSHPQKWKTKSQRNPTKSVKLMPNDILRAHLHAILVINELGIIIVSVSQRSWGFREIFYCDISATQLISGAYLKLLNKK